MPSRSAWLPIAVIYIAGVLASAQLGKMSALLPLMRHDLALDLTTAALLVSLIEIGGATLGLFAGLAVRRAGPRNAMLAGLLLLAVASLGMSATSAAAGLYLWRLVEAAAYLALVVAAPTLVIAVASAAQRATALALWSTFFPVGFACGSVLAGVAADLVPWRMVLLGSGVITALLLVPAWRLPAPRDGARSDGLHPLQAPAGAWLLALGFACYTVFEVGMLAVLPSYFAGRYGLALSTAGLVTGAAAGATVLGGILAAWWMRGSRPTGGLMAASIAVPALLLFLVFAPLDEAWAWPAAAAIALNALSGVVPALVFARLPEVVGPHGDMATANGLLAQGGASGSLLGPPLLAGAATQWGWTAAAGAGLVASLLCLALLAASAQAHATWSVSRR